jgi:hypothetical protein
MKKNPILTAVALLALLMTLGVASASGTERDVEGTLQAKYQFERGGGNGRLSTSAATSQCWDDTSGDTMNMSTGEFNNFPKADLVRWCATYDVGQITLKHRNATPTSPTADPNWANGFTGLLWDVDVNGDDVGEYNVSYLNDGTGTVIVSVNRASDNTQVCTGRGSYDGTFYAATFEASCVGSPRAIHVDAFMVYDSQWDDPDAPLYGDIADFFGGPVEQAPPPSGDEPQPAPGRDHFDDDDGNVHEDNINFIFEQGLIRGCGERLFCPNQPLTRAQFATIMANFLRSQ